MASATELAEEPSGEQPDRPAAAGADRAFPVGWRRLGLEALLPTGVALLYAAILYRIWDLRWETPIYENHSDARGVGATVKTIADTGWWLNNPHLNFPFGLQQQDFPAGGETLQMLALRVMSWVSPGYAQTMNVYYLAGFGVVALVAFLVLRHFRFPFLLSAVLALAYTYLPYHVLHEQSHLTRSTYFTGPLAVLLILWSLSWRERFLRDPDPPEGTPWRANLRRGRVAAAVVIAVVIGATETMTTAFTMTVLAGCAIVAALRWRDPGRLAVAGGLVAVLAATFVVVSIPTLAFTAEHGKNQVAAKRVVVESEYYSLKISRLVLAPGDHRLKPWGTFGQKGATGSPIPGEGGMYLGVLGIVGFIAALLRLFSGGLTRTGRRDLRPTWDRVALADHSSLIVAIALVAGTVAGFNVVLATIGFSQVRTWGRIEVILAFSALMLTGILLLWLADRYRSRVRHPAVVGAVALLAMTGLALFDGIKPAYRDYAGMEASWVSDERFVRQIDSEMPEGSAILQLPLQSYPEAGPLEGMPDYDQFRGYLHDDGSLYWSYGGVKGRPGADWQLRVRNHIGPIGALPALVGMGYDGVWLNNRGYADGGEGLASELEDEIGSAPIISEDGTLRYWDLTDYKRDLDMTDAELRDLAQEQLGIAPPPADRIGEAPADNAATTPAEWTELTGVAP